MKDKYKINDINDTIEKNSELAYGSLLKKYYSSKRIMKLIENTHEFCKEEFPALINSVRREKRLLEFETPNRINHSYEYTINNGLINTSEFYYLFTPLGRLDWLKIYFEGERVSIADHSIVKKKLLDVLKDEINTIKKEENITSEQIIDSIYDSLETLPCFIEINVTDKFKKQPSSLLQINFFSSLIKVQSNTSPVIRFFKSLFSPINEKRISYKYIPTRSDISSWLYLRAPNNFEINSQPEKKDINIETAKVSDPSIASYVIKKGHKSDFLIDILVPASLKIWYHTIYYLTFVFIIFLLLYFLDKSNIPSSISNGLGFLNDVFLIFNNQLLINTSLVLIAAIIATRGWLIIEENVLKSISIKFSYAIIVLIILTFLIGIK